MSISTKRGLGILAAAALLGLFGDGLLRAVPWGINLVLWAILLLGGLVLLARRHDLALPAGVRWPLALAVVFSAALTWRASPVLTGVNLLSMLLCLGLATLRLQVGGLQTLALRSYAAGLLLSGLQALGGFGRVLAEVRWGELPRGRWSRVAQAVLRGVAIALPLLLLFGGLLTAADAAFAGVMHRMFAWNLSTVFSHVLLTLLWAWIAAGVLREMLATVVPAAEPQPDPPVQPTPAPPRPFGLGIVEIGTMLGLLNLLFLAFVLVQFRYFFGGATTITSPDGLLTYAEYARRGFFELVTVSGLALPLLLLSHWLLRKEEPAHERLYRLLAGAMVALLVVIMVSAVQRMRLYQAAYGLTELRLYTTAFMGWLALVFGWFVATVLRGQRQRFTFGALVVGLATALVLNALNPDALIARTNLGRMAAAVALDTAYLTSLSADAVPAIVQRWPAIPPEVRCPIGGVLLERWGQARDADWRSWNWGRTRAAGAVDTQRAALSSGCQP